VFQFIEHRLHGLVVVRQGVAHAVGQTRVPNEFA